MSKGGRPPTKQGAWDRPRQLGRVDDATWATLKKAARDEGMTFTAWALAYLLPIAQETVNNQPIPKNFLDGRTRS